MILQDHKAFANVAEFDAATNHIRWRRREPGEPFRISGWIGDVGHKQVLLFKNEGRLFLRVGGDDLPVDEISAELLKIDHRRHLKIRRAGAVVFDVEYAKPVISPPINDVLSPGEDEESYDYGLMLYNILSDPERRNVGLETWV